MISASTARTIVVSSLAAAAIGVLAWQAGLFDLSGANETVIVPQVSRTDPADSPSGSGAPVDRAVRELNIVTLLPYDAIPAIFDPEFVTAAEASDPDASGGPYKQDEKVLGIEINGDARAYSVPMLSRHEVVNDTVGGMPIAVTW
jgi:hypothetical protein